MTIELCITVTRNLQRGSPMEFDTDAVDDATLALMFLTLAHGGNATWKGYDWDTIDRLYEKGVAVHEYTELVIYDIWNTGDVKRKHGGFVRDLGSSYEKEEWELLRPELQVCMSGNCKEYVLGYDWMIP